MKSLRWWTAVVLGLNLGLLTNLEAAATSPLDQVPLGETLEGIQRRAGARNLTEGGPSSAYALQIELTGPIASDITGSSDGSVLLVFESQPQHRNYRLTYLTWKLSEEQEVRLFGLQKQSGRPLSETRCGTYGPMGRLGVRPSNNSWKREAVLEVSKNFRDKTGLPGKQMRPFYGDICPDGPP